MPKYFANSIYCGGTIVTVDERIDNCQAGIIYYDYGERLISYTTVIIDYNKTGQELYCTGLYSRTTISHICRYLKRYKYLNYYDIKTLVLLNEKSSFLWCIKNPHEKEWYYYNTETGECLYPDELKITPKKIKYKLRGTENWYSLT